MSPDEFRARVAIALEDLRRAHDGIAVIVAIAELGRRSVAEQNAAPSE